MYLVKKTSRAQESMIYVPGPLPLLYLLISLRHSFWSFQGQFSGISRVTRPELLELMLVTTACIIGPWSRSRSSVISFSPCFHYRNYWITHVPQEVALVFRFWFRELWLARLPCWSVLVIFGFPSFWKWTASAMILEVEWGLDKPASLCLVYFLTKCMRCRAPGDYPVWEGARDSRGGVSVLCDSCLRTCWSAGKGVITKQYRQGLVRVNRRGCVAQGLNDLR